ncbi:MAG: hypothetical protein DMF81_19565 [Acidobacteria bacterium]|nr:MAG: hypothetical protein DMF81_19565 [Acidobacteriota bacterium]
MADVARFVGAGFTAQAELAGPGLSETLTLPALAEGEAAPADPLLLPLPPLATAGDYTLSSVRIVAGGRTVLDVASRVTIDVIDQVLVTSVKTRPLTLDEIREKGIVLDRDDYLGFEFTLGLSLESKPVNITFPVVFDRQGVPLPQPLSPPAESPRSGVALPPLPTIVPVLLEGQLGEGPTAPRVKLELPGGQPIQIPSVLVIPGNVGYLKQFFSAQLFVANGAPAGSGLVVRDVTGTLELPPGADLEPGTADDPLALPEISRNGQTITQPLAMPVLGVGPDGEPGTADDGASFRPGEQGQAARDSTRSASTSRPGSTACPSARCTSRERRAAACSCATRSSTSPSRSRRWCAGASSSGSSPR